MRTTTTPSQQELKELLDYDPETGTFTWLLGKHAGEQAGYVSEGRRRIKISQVKYQASRLAWRWVTGEDPGGLTVDHADCDPANNAWANLRLATQVQQELNKARRRRKHDLPKGAYYQGPGRYMSKIVIDGSCVYLGVFKTPDEAHAAYCKAAQEHFDSKFWRAS